MNNQMRKTISPTVQRPAKFTIGSTIYTVDKECYMTYPCHHSVSINDGVPVIMHADTLKKLIKKSQVNKSSWLIKHFKYVVKGTCENCKKKTYMFGPRCWDCSRVCWDCYTYIIDDKCTC